MLKNITIHFTPYQNAKNKTALKRVNGTILPPPN